MTPDPPFSPHSPVLDNTIGGIERHIAHLIHVELANAYRLQFSRPPQPPIIEGVREEEVERRVAVERERAEELAAKVRELETGGGAVSNLHGEVMRLKEQLEEKEKTIERLGYARREGELALREAFAAKVAELEGENKTLKRLNAKLSKTQPAPAEAA
jgi:predicted RNase H-like nuclease (RuvC/YqgF family)